MLQTAAIKVSLNEPRARFLDMLKLLKSFGTSAVHMIHVDNGSEKRQEQIGQTLVELAEEAREIGFDATATIRSGHAPTQILSAAKEMDVDFLGMYWLPKGVLVQALLGSIDADILRMCDIPVFVYNRSLMNASTRVERVLYATDFKATDAKVMPYLINKDFQAQHLYLLHVGERAPDPATEHRRQRCVQENLERLAAECHESYASVNVLQVVGNSRKRILRQASINKVDLIVVGKSDRPRSLKNFLGSTAEALPDKSQRSVFIVPGYF